MLSSHTEVSKDRTICEITKPQVSRHVEPREGASIDLNLWYGSKTPKYFDVACKRLKSQIARAEAIAMTWGRVEAPGAVAVEPFGMVAALMDAEKRRAWSKDVSRETRPVGHRAM